MLFLATFSAYLPGAALATPQEARKISTSGSLILGFCLMGAFVPATDFLARCLLMAACQSRTSRPVTSCFQTLRASGSSGFSSFAQGGVSRVCPRSCTCQAFGLSRKKQHQSCQFLRACRSVQSATGNSLSCSHQPANIHFRSFHAAPPQENRL